MATLSDLVQMVRGQIRDTGPQPVFAMAKKAQNEGEKDRPDELEQFVCSAIADYSGYRPLRKPGQLSLVASQSAYAMPDDYLAMIEFPRSGYEVSGTMLYFNPSQCETVTFWYKALHTPETIPASDHPPIAWLATALALRAVVSDPAKLKQYASYKIPDVFEADTENVTELGKELLKTANEYEKQYLARVNTQIEQQDRKPRPFATFG